MKKEEMEIKRIVRDALKKEFGFTVSTLKEIVLQEESVCNNKIYVLFRIGNKIYKLHGTTIVRV